MPGCSAYERTPVQTFGRRTRGQWYPDLSYSDFAKVTGAASPATLTPLRDHGSWHLRPGRLVVDRRMVVVQLGVGYENPLSATVAAGLRAVSMTIGGCGIPSPPTPEF